MIGLSVLIGVLSAFSGFWVAYALDASIAGSIATMVGFFFGLVFLLTPERGILTIARQRWEFSQTMLAIHLLNHEGLPEAEKEFRVAHMREHMRLEPTFLTRVVRYAERRGIIVRENGHLRLAEQGRQLAQHQLSLSRRLIASQRSRPARSPVGHAKMAIAAS